MEDNNSKLSNLQPFLKLDLQSVQMNKPSCTPWMFFTKKSSMLWNLQEFPSTLMPWENPHNYLWRKKDALLLRWIPDPLIKILERNQLLQNHITSYKRRSNPYHNPWIYILYIYIYIYIERERERESKSFERVFKNWFSSGKMNGGK